MWNEKGRYAGRNLEDPVPYREAIRRWAEAEIRTQLADNQGRLTVAIARSERYNAYRKRRQTLIDRLRTDAQALDEERNLVPSGFSVVKGLFYLALSLLLILADFGLLGQVTARFLGYPWYSNGVSFVSLLFTQPLSAIGRFPDLFFLVLSVLLLGFFLKVWQDVEDSNLEGWRGLRERIVFSTLLVCSLLSIILMSAARLGMRFGDTTAYEGNPHFPGIVTFVLGFTLPLVSAGFFARGYDALEKRYQLFRICRRLQYNEFVEAWLSEKKASADAEVTKLQQLLEQFDGDESLEDLVRARQDDFDTAYYDAAFQLLDSPRLVERLRPVAVRRAITRRVA